MAAAGIVAAPALARERWIARPWLAIALAGVIPVIARLLLLPVLPVPKPAIQDEFSYLLAADTFASGRLANPPHPLAPHFETLHVLSHPTYASQYPPFSGLLMALGQKLAGEPWAGVLLSAGLMCAALCWALEGWLPRPWALTGTAAAVLKIGIVSYWTESYWGGTCAALGGALLIGAMPRLMRRARRAAALAFAAGLIILANTRPYEGLVLAAACWGWLAWGLRGQAREALRTIVLPAALLLVPAAAWMGYYNYRVTGNALTLPYLEHDRQYGVWPPFLWSARPAAVPDYSSATLRDFWQIADASQKQDSHDHWIRAHVSDLRQLSGFLLGWPLALCLLATAPWLWRDPPARAAVLLGLTFYAGLFFEDRLFPHYAAPATALAYILAAAALRAACTVRKQRLAERWYLGSAIAVLFLLNTGMNLLAPDNRYLFGAIDYHVAAKHTLVESELQGRSGDHLVLVRYGARHDLYEELVYNRANINAAKIVWARSLGVPEDRNLLSNFPRRAVWLLEDDGQLKLTDYATGQTKVLFQGTSTSVHAR